MVDFSHYSAGRSEWPLAARINPGLVQDIDHLRRGQWKYERGDAFAADTHARNELICWASDLVSRWERVGAVDAAYLERIENRIAAFKAGGRRAFDRHRSLEPLARRGLGADHLADCAARNLAAAYRPEGVP